MSRPKGALNRSKRGAVHEPERSTNAEQAPDLLQMDREVLDGMGKTNRMRLTHSDAGSLSLRQQQAAGAEYLASLISHPEIRKRLAEEGLRDPMTLLKIASSERPKEVHLEADIQHSVVVVPAQLTAAAWDAEILALEDKTEEEKPW